MGGDPLSNGHVVGFKLNCDIKLTGDTSMQATEIQTMYSLNLPVSAIRTKIRQEFEKHRYVSQIPAIDVLLFKSHAEFQVSTGHCERQGHLLSGEYNGEPKRGKGSFKSIQYIAQFCIPLFHRVANGSMLPIPSTPL